MEATYGTNTLTFRGLTRGEVFELTARGVDFSAPAAEDPLERERMLTLVLSAAVDQGEDALQALTPGEALDLFIRVCRATFLTPEQLKNSQAPQPNGLPEGSLTVARAGGTD
ncbi:MAG: hypothetical protein JRI97_09405 [Deltaproteobacteria bacterium]|nr:hypothetical protein [Deltaproteobacteria bacterium]